MIVKNLTLAVFFSILINASLWGQGLETAANKVPETAIKPQPEPQFCCQKKFFGVANAEIFALLALPWYFNRHVADDITADLSLKSWKNNINLLAEWDPNSFATNMFMHPYHGNVYFNAARANGYDFWESAPFAFTGSILWEMFGETNRPAINDWAMTSLAGITIGEALHHAAKSIRDNQARGARRAFLEFAGLLVDPVGGFARLWRGEMSRIGPNPPDRSPSRFNMTAMFGIRNIGEGRLTSFDKSKSYFDFTMLYGDQLEDFEHPFDHFSVSVQLNGSDTTPIGRLQIHGVLLGTELKRTDKVLHVFTINSLYDYWNNELYEVGGQSFGFSLRSRWQLSNRWNFQTLFRPSAVIVGGVISEYVDVADRDYDFGSGVGLETRAGFRRSNIDVFTLIYWLNYTHTLAGAAGDQFVHLLQARARVPIWRSFGIGLDYIRFFRNGFFRDFPRIHRQAPELRVSMEIFF